MKGYYTKAYAVLDEKKADAVLVSDGYNMRYLSGFRGATGYLYISKKRQVLMTDSRYTTMAKEEAPDFEVQQIVTGQTYGQMVNALIVEEGAQHVAYEDAYMLCKTYQELQEACGGKIDIPLDESLDLLRSVKADWELEYLAKAESIGDQAFTHMLDVLKPGITELEVAAELEYFMKMHGAENLSFETIVASGPNSAMPHAMPSNRKLEKGDFVTMDFGCLYQGYCSDMTRTIVIGKANDKQKEIYSVVLGHSVGLFIHEEPRLSMLCKEIILPNMIQTVEPGIYVPGFGGVRIEDMVVVTEDGHRNLAHSPKELIEL